jgi:hypothetical protein
VTAPAHDGRRPRDPATGEPLAPRPQPGYYPGFHTLDQRAFWDEATRQVILARLQPAPPPRFFSAAEASLMTAVCDRLLPQDDRDEAHKIPLVTVIDQRLHEGRIDGYRYAGMPPDGEAHRLGLQGIEAIAASLFGAPFTALTATQQDTVLLSLHDGRLPAGAEIWRQLPVDRYWLLLIKDVVAAYYAHPYAWDEIGFGGPAYPRGYMRLERGEPEPWEVAERRYPWLAPPGARSGAATPLGKPEAEEHKP